MKKRFRFKLFFTMIVFAIVTCFTVAIIDYNKITDQVIEHNQFQIEQIEDTVTYTLKTLDKSYYLFDDETASMMEQNTHYLLDQYDENPDFTSWDFEALRESLGMDIYIIDQSNVITHSTFKDDIGLDFTKCCSKLVPVLEERRASGEFYHDGMDIEQKTGDIKKYSYMATRDKKYLIELGYSLRNGTILKEFDFLTVNEELVKKYPSVNEINVLNIGGFTLGASVDETKLPKERRSTFEKALTENRVSEYRGEWQGDPAVYRYVPYTSDFDLSTTKNKIIEIVYNEKELNTILSNHQQSFYIQLTIIMMVSIIISFIISKWVSKPMYLAFHDSLTGLNNRAAFEEWATNSIQSSPGITAVMMLDIDHFKEVNDHYGHDEGDKLLKKVAETIRCVIGKDHSIFRYGGDEFIVILKVSNKKEAEAIAKNLLKELNKNISNSISIEGVKVSASIGLAFSPEHGIKIDRLCKKADIALYASKGKGKDQYRVYSDDLIQHQITSSNQIAMN